mgnify:CR=1 FL=1
MVTDVDLEDLGEQPRSLLPKSPTGITGFDEITGGGVPAGRPSLVCGPPGAGKSLFALQFVVNGITRYGEHGLFLTFEQSRADVVADVGPLHYDLDGLAGAGRGSRPTCPDPRKRGPVHWVVRPPRTATRPPMRRQTRRKTSGAA